MGLLSRFPGLLQGWGAFDPFGQQQQNPLAPTPFFPQQPQEGGNQPTPPFVLNANAQQPPQAQPQQQATQGGFMQRMQGMFDNPALQLGVSLLGHARGSDWAGVGQDMQGFSQQRMLKQRMDNEERRATAQENRESTAFGRQQTQWGNEDQQRRDWEAAVARETDPARQATLRAMGPQGYGEWMAGEQTRAFNAQQAQLDRDIQVRGQNMSYQAQTERMRDPRERYQYQADYRRLAEMGTAANFGQQYVVPRLNRAEQIITRLAQIGGMSSPLDANRRIQLSQLGQFGAEARGLLQELNRIQTQFTVEDARALAPVSNTDFGRLQEINPNGNMTVDAAYRIVNTMRSEVQRGLNNYTSASQWFDRNDGLTGTLDPQGRTFEQVQGEQYRDAGRDPASAPSQPTTASPPQQAAPRRTATLPSARGVQEGTRAYDTQTQRWFTVRGGQWVPEGRPSTRDLNNGNLR